MNLTNVTLDQAREALTLSGHGLHPHDAITLCMVALNVDPLPGSRPRMEPEQVERALANLVTARERRLRRES